jgi:hypothetical protein
MTRFFIASIAALLLATECAPPFRPPSPVLGNPPSSPPSSVSHTDASGTFVVRISFRPRGAEKEDNDVEESS